MQSDNAMQSSAETESRVDEYLTEGIEFERKGYTFPEGIFRYDSDEFRMRAYYALNYLATRVDELEAKLAAFEGKG